MKHLTVEDPIAISKNPEQNTNQSNRVVTYISFFLNNGRTLNIGTAFSRDKLDCQTGQDA